MENTTQTTPAHTAGPWRYHRLKIDDGSEGAEMFRISTEAPTHPDIADVFYRDTDAEAEANACLIAAAPELLATLQSILNDCNDFWDEKMDISTSDLVCAIEAAAGSAIAKANGKPATNTTRATQEITTATSLVEKALDAFWEVVAAHYPNAMTGDLSVERTAALDLAAEAAVKEWIGNNVLPQHDDGKAS